MPWCCWTCGTDEAVVVRAIADMDRFLAALGYLSGPPTVISTETAPGSNPAMVALANRADAAIVAAGEFKIPKAAQAPAIDGPDSQSKQK